MEPPRAGDEDPLAMDCPRDGLGVQFNWVTPEDVFNRHGLDVTDLGGASHHVVERRQGERLQAQAFCRVRDRPDLRRVCRVHADEQGRRPRLPCHVGKVAEVTEDLQVVDS